MLAGMEKQPLCLDQTSEAPALAGEPGQVGFIPCFCQCVTWQGWSSWTQIPPPLSAESREPESSSSPSSSQWHLLPQGDLHSLLWEAVNYTPITAWKWLGKYFERCEELCRNHCFVSRLWMEKGEPRRSSWQKICWMLSILTAPLPLFFPPFLISFPFYTCYSKPDETIVSKLIFFSLPDFCCQ